MKRKHMLRSCCGVLAVLAISTATGTAGADPGEVVSPSETIEGAPVDGVDLDAWRFSAELYAWLPEITGSASIGDDDVGIGVSIKDVLDLVGRLDAWDTGAHFEARKDDLSLFADVMFLAVDTNKAFGPEAKGQARFKMLNWFVEWAAAYRVFEYPTSFGAGLPIYVEGLAGARYNRMSTEIGFERLSGPDAKSVIDFVDPMVGGRFGVPIFRSDGAGSVAIEFRGDIGGFGAGSDLAWNIVSGLHWEMPWRLGAAVPTFDLGYKAYYFDVSSESGGVKSELELEMKGPALRLGVEF